MILFLRWNYAFLAIFFWSVERIFDMNKRTTSISYLFLHDKLQLPSAWLKYTFANMWCMIYAPIWSLGECWFWILTLIDKLDDRFQYVHDIKKREPKNEVFWWYMKIEEWWRIHRGRAFDSTYILGRWKPCTSNTQQSTPENPIYRGQSRGNFLLCHEGNVLLHLQYERFSYSMAAKSLPYILDYMHQHFSKDLGPHVLK